ncbi:hypothetical protein FJ251_04730 [bacterium]|nr:hypothetical protein [bacterium]
MNTPGDRHHDDESRLDALIAETLRDYHRPPEAPRDRLWARIEAERGAREARPRPQWRSPWLWLPAAAAALLLVGIMIGRDTLREDAERALVGQAEEHGREKAALIYRLASTPVLARSEALLTQFRSAAWPPGADSEQAGWAKELLLEARLLLDSPAAADPELKRLLEDLELILVQIAEASASGDPTERALITEGLEARRLLPRLRERIPAGDIPQGV